MSRPRFRASPRSDAPEDARRIFDALNWARAEWPDMSLALTDAKGGERLAKRWAQQKGVRLVLAKPDFARFGRAAPFRANDQMLALGPACVLLLPESLGRAADAGAPPFGPAMNLADEPRRRGLRCVRITARVRVDRMATPPSNGVALRAAGPRRGSSATITT